MQGWLLFVHAVKLVFTNFGTAMRLSLVPYAFIAVVSVWVELAKAGTGDPLLPAQGTSIPWTEIMVLSAVSAICTPWIAINWHRFVLLEQYPSGVVPAWGLRRIFSYLYRTLIVALPVIAVGLFAIVGLILLVQLFSDPWIIPILGTGLGVVMLIIGLRFSMILPAIALDQDMGLSESWSVTRPIAGPIVVLALLSGGLSFLIGLPLDGGDPSSGALVLEPMTNLQLVYSMVVGWINLMIGISILTTLYGVCVEKREIG